MRVEELYQVLETFDWENHTLTDIEDLENRIDGQKELIQILKQHRHAFVAGRYTPDLVNELVVEPKATFVAPAATSDNEVNEEQE